MAEALRTPADIVDLALKEKPDLVVHAADLPSTAEALRTLLATSDRLFDRGVPVRFTTSADGSPVAVPMNKNHVVMEAHRLCRPVKANAAGERVPVTLPDRVAQMFLDMGEWGLNPLTGFSTAPLLSGDGSFRSINGYDIGTGLWCSSTPLLHVPATPTKAHAEAALGLIRSTFRTFPFGDAARMRDQTLGVDVVDTTQAPGQDESAFLIGLMTACCRASLWLAPGLLLTAPSLSGAGSGKGLLVRAICMIAYGIKPRAFTTGSDRTELEKRLAAELVEAQPALFLDNANGVALRSDTLASVLTERPARVRLLGQTLMVPLNSTAFIAVTGNGLTVTEDLARRFLTCKLDARCEDPESRPFRSGFLDDVRYRRAELLGAVLTIWRWRRQNPNLERGKPLGSFEEWSEWCRDPLIALGCDDPVKRIEFLKAHDPKRQHVASIFAAWWENHGDRPMRVNQLAEGVKDLIDAQHRGRQYLATYVAGLAGTHAAGFVLSRQESAGKWTAATYVLAKIDGPGAVHPMSPMRREDQSTAVLLAHADQHADASASGAEPIGHRTHRTDRGAKDIPNVGHRPDADPMGPISPMPDGPEDEGTLPPGKEATL